MHQSDSQPARAPRHTDSRQIRGQARRPNRAVREGTSPRKVEHSQVSGRTREEVPSITKARAIEEQA